MLCEASPIDRLDGDEAERDPDEQAVAARPPLVEVDQDRGERRGDDPRRQPFAARARRRTRRAAGSPPAGTRAAPSSGLPRTSARSGRRLLALQPLQLLLAPLRPPLVEVDAPAQDEIDEVRVLAAGQGGDRAQDLQVLLVAARAALEQPERLLAREVVGEEEPQQRLVAQLDRGGRAEQPRSSAPHGRPRSACRRAARARRSARPRPRSGPRPRAGAARDRSGRSSPPRRSASSGRPPS